MLFLGAGATSPLGKLLMKDFITKLNNDGTFGPNKLFQQIVRVNPDLEYLFEELEDWTQKGYLENVPLNLGILGGLGSESRQSPSPVSSVTISRAARMLIAALRKEVFEAYKDIDDPAKVAPIFVPLLDGIFTQLDAQKFPLVVFTTNYDPAIELFCQRCSSSYELVDGFSEEKAVGAFCWKKENFDSAAVPGQNKTIVLFKLHGSASWVRRKGQVIKLPFPVYAGGGEDYENALIYPATRKVAIDDPFFTAYDYLQRTLDGCGCCIVIGYSFRDYDALTKLVSASIFNPRLRLLVVDPNAEALCRNLSERGIRCTAAPQRFGKDGEYLHLVGQHVAEAIRSPSPGDSRAAV